MKRFINDPVQIVEQVIEGITLADPQLRRLDGLHVLCRASLPPEQVAVISGGGSGHEPAMGGYVGPGLLSAAVAGGLFASPSVKEVLQAIRAVTGPAGCLVVIMNYTGDRLNFGVAVEQARAEGLLVEMVVVADDCALPPDKGITGRRGVAGTVLVHKIAGAAAAAGKSLDEVKQAALAAIGSVGTLGVALSTCTVPGGRPGGGLLSGLAGQPRSDRLNGDAVEVGLGIHGEPGMERLDKCPAADELVDRMLLAIVEQGYLPLEEGGRVGLLINNLGAGNGGAYPRPRAGQFL